MTDNESSSKIQEFVAQFTNILEKGFLESLTIDTMSSDGKPYSYGIRVWGLIPNDPKYAAVGCGAIIQPTAILEMIRRAQEECVQRERKLTCNSMTAKIDNWPLFDDAGENTIGSRGQSVELYLRITFI